MLSRPVTPAQGIANVRVAIPRDEPAQAVARARTVSGPRPRTALAGVAVVLAVLFVGMFYLSQTFEAAAARYEVEQLRAALELMLRELQSQQGSTLALGAESTVIQWAQGEGLERLLTRQRFTPH